MSYYLLPTKNTVVDIFLDTSETIIEDPYISHSLEHYLKATSEQIKTSFEDASPGYAIDAVEKFINTHEYIFTKVPGSKFSVSKMKVASEEFYCLLEIMETLNLLEDFENKKMNIMVHGSQHEAITECIDFLRENNKDNYTPEHFKHCVDLLYYELNNTTREKYITSAIDTLKNILECQGKDGMSIIKLNSIVDKPILDIIFLLTSLYEKIYIIKPHSSNTCNGDRYIVSKNFKFSLENIHYYLSEINFILTNRKDKYILSIIKQDLPYYFLNKIEESNLIIGHQQLETMEQVINLLKNRNKEDKIESLKKNNIQKCIQWCEKHKIPYNKFVDKVNIFLNAVIENENQHESEYGNEENTIF